MKMYLDPKMDFIFKKILSDEDVLLDFVRSALSKTEGNIVSVKIVNPETKREFIEDKYSILDVRAVTEDGRIINIEIQRKDEKNMGERSLFHWSKLYSEQISLGDSYRKLKKTICINILDFNYTDEEHFHSIYILKELERNNPLQGAPLEIHFIELKKFEKHAGLATEEGLSDWIEFLNAPNTVEEKKNPSIKKALQTLETLSLDKETRELYKLRKDAQDEGRRQLNSKFDEGLEEGFEQGREQVRFEVIKNSLLAGLTLETISSITGASLTEIQSVKNSLT